MPKARAPTIAAAAERLKHAAKDDIEVLDISTPKRRVYTEDDRFIGIETKPEAVIVLEVLEVQIAPTIGDLARIVEERSVQSAPDLPPVLALRKKRVQSTAPGLTAH